MAETGYDPKRSKVNKDKLDEFVQRDIKGDLEEVPGIGPAAVKKLAEPDAQGNPGITTTYQLIGAYLSLKNSECDPVSHNDYFWYWLKEKGISSHRSGIVQCIAKKCNSFMPGLYDPSMYESDDEEE
ncbi:hypothetical protein FisN_3Lh424 [Fistulifera solaris]|uniref:Uncharacterized protein n=1 Tax=Fistulifera solaris TaxID=1519565 RepID=A0A1Z5J8B1_FISSO|nr:hypothetical protein FisN_3Lh424 [Fistulifera solaris]|eukprot:GAX10227.1 hypothetical protein FisN_3Lh424 [Fistulifera solaris]